MAPVGCFRQGLANCEPDLDHLLEDPGLTVPVCRHGCGGRCWGLLPSLGLPFFLLTTDQRGGCQGSLDLLFPCRRLRCWGGRGRQGWCSPFWELKALQPSCCWPLLPPSSSSPMISAGNRAPGNSCSLTSSSSFLLLQVQPASQGVGEGHHLPQLRPLPEQPLR